MRPAGFTDKCRKCGGEMVIGVALVNTPRAGVPDFPGGEPIGAGQTFSMDGPVMLVPCLKCTECGRSIRV